MLGRIFFLTAIVCSLSLVVGCSHEPLVVVQAPAAELSFSSLSVQTSAPKSAMGIIAPNARYAKWLLPRLKNRLTERGFVLKSANAEMFLQVHVQRITTGGTARTAEVELRVLGYSQDPGDLEKRKGKPKAGVEALFEWKVALKKKQLKQGYEREQLAREVALEALELVVARLAEETGLP